MKMQLIIVYSFSLLALTTAENVQTNESGSIKTSHGSQETTTNNQYTPLCNIDGIQKEIEKALHLLKKREISQQEKDGQKLPNVLRQDDNDDDDIPYYVPAIAKVVGSVLAQNATNIIEESFGFIPPEVNKNIRYVLGLVTETIEKLRPMMGLKLPVKSATTVSSSEIPVNVDPAVAKEQISDIESLLSFALNQNLDANKTDSTPIILSTGLNETIIDNPNPSLSFLNLLTDSSAQNSDADSLKLVQSADLNPMPIVTTDAPSEEAEGPTNNIVAQDVASTFSSSYLSRPTTAPEFLKTVSMGVVNNGLSFTNDVSVYAPAYAPNYGVTTTKIPMYAPAFDHNEHKYIPTTSASINTDLKNNLHSPTNSPIFPPKEKTSTTEENVVTTEDDDDENGNEDNTVTSIVSGSSTTNPETTIATDDDDEENDEDYENVK